MLGATISDDALAAGFRDGKANKPGLTPDDLAAAESAFRTELEALAKAEEEGLDLVEIQPNADPPVCRIMDFGKFKFETQKKAAAAKKKQKVVEIQEVKFRPVTDEGDYKI